MKEPLARVTDHEISLAEVYSYLSDPAQGAQAYFVGTVRNENNGRKVDGVTYDCYQPLAENMLREIASEIQSQFGKELIIVSIHRIGYLGVGEISVAIGVSAPHREEAFKGCRHIIEEIKRRVPIWKEEHYADGESAWLDGVSLGR